MEGAAGAAGAAEGRRAAHRHPAHHAVVGAARPGGEEGDKGKKTAAERYNNRPRPGTAEAELRSLREEGEYGRNVDTGDTGIRPVG